MQFSSFQPPPKSSFQPEGEHIKEDKGKKALSSEEAEKESTKSGSNDETTHMHEQISAQKEIKEEAKAKAARREGEIRKEELIDLLGLKVVNKYYNDKLQYDKYCDKILNKRAASRITNCDVLTRKGLITLKVYREDNTSEIIPNFKARTRLDYINTTEVELGINLDIPLSKQGPLDKLNDLANKKRKHADDIYDYFKSNKRLKSSAQYEDHLPGLDDHARTFSSLLLAEIDKRNLNPLKQMRVIEQLRQ
ncbi:hypothetical protein Tco_0394171 [Tanacetum coccineum]